MKRSTFARDTRILSSITLGKIEKAKKEEERGCTVSDPAIKLLYKHIYAIASQVLGTDQRRYQLRSKIKSMSIMLNPPSLWITINPNNLHDPIPQIFVGEEIDMDRFSNIMGPDKERRAINIVNDPYASAWFFRTLLSVIMETLFGIKVTECTVEHTVGIFGLVNAYVGTVESQNHGSLHAHMMVWLTNAPTSEEMKKLLQLEDFRAQVIAFIEQNLKAYIPGLESKESIKNIPNEIDIAYSRPPHPDSSDYDSALKDYELRVVRAMQIHTCSAKRCLVQVRGKPGVFHCKRRTPFETSPHDFVHEDGRWAPKRLYDHVNGWIPAISINGQCNNDGKLLTNGEATKNLATYVSYYQTKKQGRSFNLSTIVKKGYRTHCNHNAYHDNLLNNQRLLIFHLVHTINREQELAAPLVMSYLMGWDDNFTSHNYNPIFWSSFVSSLLAKFPDLQRINVCDHDRFFVLLSSLDCLVDLWSETMRMSQVLILSINRQMLMIMRYIIHRIFH